MTQQREDGQRKYGERERRMDEALLEHYDDLMLVNEYNTVLDRMRRNGYTPTGPGAPRNK